MPSLYESSSLLGMLQQQLLAARRNTARVRAKNESGQMIQVPGTGRTISSAYEQLRNAAEYTEEQLLLQRAIRRFFNRNISFSFGRNNVGASIGEELVVELTQAGYLRNGTIAAGSARHITKLVDYYLDIYQGLRKEHVASDDACDWVLDLLSVETEETFNPHSELNAFAYFAYHHFLGLFPQERLATTPAESEAYEISLYIGVYQALLKSDLANLRYDLICMYGQSPQDMKAFVEFNRKVGQLYYANFTQRLRRAVSKYGAPMRILKSLIDDYPELPEMLDHRESFLQLYAKQVEKEYGSVKRRLNKGLAKSICFIFITKVIVGIAIEVPYDIIFHGSVALLPLGVNLFFPPLYMASLRLGVRLPTRANAEALQDYIDGVLYTNALLPRSSLRIGERRPSGATQVATLALFFVPFVVMVFVLNFLQFNIVQGIIFVMFLSTASFLGFRLSRMVRELEIIKRQPSALAALRDCFYLPFILLGQWMSRKYARFNAVALILDLAIELPLKTILRLMRQWSRFISDKHDEIY